MLLLATSQRAEEQTTGGFVAWSELRSRDPSMVKVDPQRRYVAQMERGWGECPVRVWRLRSDLSLGEELFTTRGKGFVVLDMEWVGSQLLMKVVEGVKTYWELDKKPPYKTEEERRAWWAKNMKLVVWDPQTPERGLSHSGYYGEIGDHDYYREFFAHPSGGKVVAVGPDKAGDPFRMLRVFPFPLTAAERTEVKRVPLSSQIVRYRCVPLSWCPDGERFWAMGSDKHHFGKVVVMGLDGSVKRLTLDDHHLLHHAAGATQGGGVEGGLEVETLLPSPTTLVQREGKLAAIMSFPRRQREHICVSYYSAEKLERERVIIERGKPYPKSLRPLRNCTLLTVTPDGGRLVLQQGLFSVHGVEERVWVWDMDSGALTPVAKVGWVRSIYGWIGEEGMVVEMEGETGSRGQAVSYEYGVLRLPPK